MTHPCTSSLCINRTTHPLQKVKLFTNFSSLTAFKVQFYFNFSLKNTSNFFSFTTQNLIRSKQRKEFLFFCKTTCYSKHIKNEKNPQVVKHVVVHDFSRRFLGKKKSLETFCFKTFSVVEATGLEAYQASLNPFIYKVSSVCSPIVHQTFFIELTFE